MSAVRRFDWSRENIRHTGICRFAGFYVSLVIIVEYMYLTNFNLEPVSRSCL